MKTASLRTFLQDEEWEELPAEKRPGHLNLGLWTWGWLQDVLPVPAPQSRDVHTCRLLLFCFRCVSRLEPLGYK